MMSSGLNMLRDTLAAAWQPRTAIAPSVWSETEMRLNPDVEASAGRYDLSRRPYWRAVLDCAVDPLVRTLTLQCAPQLGKTLSVIAMILYLAENLPAPTLVVLPDRDAAIEFRDRVYANAIKSPKIRSLVPHRRLWNTRHIELGTMRVYLAWSGARQRMRGRPCKFVFLSEVDVYRGDKKAGDPVKAADQRVKAFHRFLIVRESSPTGEPSQIAELERATDQRRWHVPCPHCGRYQELRFFVFKGGSLDGKGGFGGLTDAAGNYLTPEEGREQAHYICIEGCKISSDDKQRMVVAGVWVPRGQKVLGKAESGKRKAEDRDGTPQLVGPQPSSRRNVGVHLWSIHSETISLGDIAAAYLEARAEGKLPDFFQNWLGLEHTNRAKQPTWKQLGERLAWLNPRGTVWYECWFLTAGADVQADGVFWEVRGWGDRGTSWQVDWGFLPRFADEETASQAVKSDLAQLKDAVLDKWYPLVGGDTNPRGLSQLRVRLLGIDANHRTMDVHEWIQSVNTDRVRAVRGDHKVDPVQKYRANLVDANTRTKEAYAGGLLLWGIYVYHFYEDLLHRMTLSAGQPRAWHVTSDCGQLGRDFLRQAANFAKRIERDSKTGTDKVTWGPITTSLGNDWWDCATYNRTMAQMIIDDLPQVTLNGELQAPGWDASLWPRPLADKPRMQETAAPVAARDYSIHPSNR